jgi:signal peptidase I
MSQDDQPNPTKNSSTEKSRPEAPGFFSFENLKSLAFLAVLIFAIRWTVASPYYVPTSSMEPTIKVGDRLLAWKLAYDLKIPFTDFSIASWGKPQRGDIIVFKFPQDPNIDYVKRIVAIGGDEVELIDDILHINGKPVTRISMEDDRSILNDIQDTQEIKMLFKEEQNTVKHWVLQNKTDYRRFGSNNFSGNDRKPFKVPEDSVFCMGDNRDNSSDSRVWGVVPLSYVRGKAMFVIWSQWSRPEQFWPSFRFDRFGKWLDT